jgi:hypothetical protein
MLRSMGEARTLKCSCGYRMCGVLYCSGLHCSSREFRLLALTGGIGGSGPGPGTSCGMGVGMPPGATPVMLQHHACTQQSTPCTSKRCTVTNFVL